MPSPIGSRAQLRWNNLYRKVQHAHRRQLRKAHRELAVARRAKQEAEKLTATYREQMIQVANMEKTA